ncbi:MAG: aminodeoxychorismate/anthranilate synthase component II [Pelagibacterales bacterium]|jgi:anthranilate synthase component 2|nr:aminodeoxychorismate/anthranilate synthase component II [Pelagibacterales bacterium]|tara:strand:- start:710 stop:1294 length:585 start_codon:yes stop_codon:yes gene_type:complete
MILLIDNYDSFTFNLAHYIEETGQSVSVIRNDKLTTKDIKNNIKPSKIIISPGPCTPDDAGICIDVIKEFYQTIPILGVCLGHQSIGQALGANIVRANKIMHGKITEMTNENNSMIFKGLPNKFNATRYHSLVIDPKSLPECFNIISTTQDDNKTVIMGIEHKEYPIYGVQFHPESIGTSMLHGKKIISNFVNL